MSEARVYSAYDFRNLGVQLYTAELVPHEGSLKRVDFCVFPNDKEKFDYELGLALGTKNKSSLSIINVKRVSSYWETKKQAGYYSERIMVHCSPYYVNSADEFVVSDMFVRSIDVINVMAMPFRINEDMQKAFHGAMVDEPDD